MTETEVKEWRQANGYWAAWEHGTHLIAVGPTIFGGTIVIGDRQSVFARWSYTTGPEALLAAIEWWLADFADEPKGWVRHQPSDRRRTYAEDGSYREEVRA